MTGTSKPLHLPWHQAQQYWLCVLPRAGTIVPPALKQQLLGLGMQEAREGAAVGYIMLAARRWGDQWAALYQALEQAGVTEQMDAAVISGDTPLDPAEIEAGRRSCEAMQAVAQSLWLGEVLMAGNLICYLQPVVSAIDKVFGFEAFVRARGEDGKIIGGGAIVDAARILSLQYAVDRHMHIQAVRTFVESGLDGALFINFIPGFIQRPEIYLEGLTEAVRTHGLVPRQVVLDLIKSEHPHDVQHVKRICEYSRARGFTVALDDISSITNVRALLPEIRPEFVKLDMALVKSVQTAQGADLIHKIVEECHARGAMVLAEGVESEAIFNTLKGLGVDLYQGYYFSPPVPVENLVKKQAG